MTHSEPASIVVGTGASAREIKVLRDTGSAPGIFWLSGFKSDMAGTKAVALSDWAREHGRACTRFDYSGHGVSGGAFEEGTISRWTEEALAVFNRFCREPTIIVGSSMGGWIALLVARALRRSGQADRLNGMVLIAPAPDFTLVDTHGMTRAIEMTGIGRTALLGILGRGACLSGTAALVREFVRQRAAA